MTAREKARMDRATPPPGWCSPDRRMRPAMTVIQMRKNQARPVKNWPALIRFFQKMATAGQPWGGKAKGGRLALLGLLMAFPVPGRNRQGHDRESPRLYL